MGYIVPKYLDTGVYKWHYTEEWFFSYLEKQYTITFENNTYISYYSSQQQCLYTSEFSHNPDMWECYSIQQANDIVSLIIKKHNLKINNEHISRKMKIDKIYKNIIGE